MKLVGSSLALALALVAAVSASAAPAPAPKAPPPTKEQLARGMKDVPALLQAGGLTCTPVAAAFRGSGKLADKSSVDIYETACQEGVGYLLLKNSATPAPQVFDCLAAASGATQCVLPQNADPKQGLRPIIASAGRTCAISDARYIGSSISSGMTLYEVACGAAPGFRLGVSKAGKPEVTDCLALLDTEGACKLTTRESALSVLQPLVQASGRPCAISGGRAVGVSTQTNSTYYEVACGAAPGFFIIADSASNKFKSALDCAKAESIGGGCKMTDTTTSETAEIATYTKLSAKAGFPCQVSKYRYIGQDSTDREIVELACSNRPDGALAAFSDKGASQIYDCVQAAGLQQSCKLSSSTPIYARYSAALAAKGRGTCKVSNAVWLGKTNTADMIEAACADGAPGWVFGLTSAGTINDLLTCRQATASGLACKLPTNVAGNKG